MHWIKETATFDLKKISAETADTIIEKSPYLSFVGEAPDNRIEEVMAAIRERMKDQDKFAQALVAVKALSEERINGKRSGDEKLTRGTMKALEGLNQLPGACNVPPKILKGVIAFLALRIVDRRLKVDFLTKLYRPALILEYDPIQKDVIFWNAETGTKYLSLRHFSGDNFLVMG